MVVGSCEEDRLQGENRQARGAAGTQAEHMMVHSPWGMFGGRETWLDSQTDKNHGQIGRGCKIKQSDLG